MSARTRLRAVPAPAPSSPEPQRVPIGAATLENADRAAYQSARSIGFVAPLPLTEAQAWAEALAMSSTPTT